MLIAIITAIFTVSTVIALSCCRASSLADERMMEELEKDVQTHE